MGHHEHQRQSLFPIDSAFKRRWDWKYVPISDAGKQWVIRVNDTDYSWWSFLDKVNFKIWDATHSEDKKLGYFFCKADKDGVIMAEKFVGKVFSISTMMYSRIMDLTMTFSKM